MHDYSIHQPNLDVIALETKHQKNYERAQRQQEFCKNYQEKRGVSFADGKYDGELDLEPEPYQWFNPTYRKGYFAGITAKFNELFST